MFSPTFFTAIVSPVSMEEVCITGTYFDRTPVNLNSTFLEVFPSSYP